MIKILQNIEHSYATLDVLAAMLQKQYIYKCNKIVAYGHLNVQGRQISYPLHCCTYQTATGAHIFAIHVPMQVLV